MIELAQPWFLLLLLALPLLILGQRRSLAAFTPAQRRMCLVLRSVILVALTLALCGVRAKLPTAGVGVLFVVDHSASVEPEARAEAGRFISTALSRRGANDAAGIIAFAAGQVVVMPPAGGPAPSSWPEIKNADATDIAAALDFSSALFPAGKGRRLVLLSDGNETVGSAAMTAARLGAAGVEVWAVPLRNPARPEVLVSQVGIPDALKEGEPFDLVATIESSVATSAKVRAFQSQFLVAERDIELKPGSTSCVFPGMRPDGNFVQYDVEVLAQDDTLQENNRGTAVASLRGQPRVLLVDSEADKARLLADALRASRISVELRTGNGAPRSLADLQQFDLFILSDVSALTLTREQMEMYSRWVSEFGGGFLLLGGENSFGVGGYFRTPVEQMLPVRMEHNDRQELPTVALLIVLDRSGSMTAQVAGQTKMSLAAQGAALALNVLSSRDYFGVLAVDTRAHVVASLARHGAKEPIAQRILSITAGGGGIYIYTSLAEASQALRDVNARIKHVIIFSDAADAEEKTAGEQPDGAQGSGSALDLVSAMAASKITTSVVALGGEQDKDTAFLRQLAERGLGRFYLTSDATTLPQIFSTETMKVAQSSLIEEPTLAVPVGKSPMTAGLDWAQSPLLLGYNATKPKPTADVFLATERGEPLLASWRHGLGIAAAFTSDAKARWAAEWVAWPGYGKFWAQVVRGLLRKSGPAAFGVTRSESGNRLELKIEALTPEGAFRNRLPVTVTARTPDGETRIVDAVQDAPGSYFAALELPSMGTTVIRVSSPELPDGGMAFAHTRSYPREFLARNTNEPLLREIARVAGGRFDPAADAVFSSTSHSSSALRELSNWFIVISLVLMPLDIFLRRRTWRVWS